MKLFLKVILGFIFVLVLAVVGLVLAFDPNDYKEEMTTLVKDKTGRDLKISGDISLSLFPWVGLELGKVEVSNAKGFSKKFFAKMTRLQVRVKLLPLFKKRIEADTVVIEGLTLNLAKNKRGISNWDDLLNNKVKTKGSPSKNSKKVNKNVPLNIFAAFAINGIEIRQSQFLWNDLQNKQSITVKNVQLKVGKLFPNTSIPFSAQFNFKQKGLAANISFESDITFSLNLKKFTFQDTQFSSDTHIESLKNMLPVKLNSELMSLDLQKQTASSQHIALSAADVKLNTSLSALKILSKPRVNAMLEIETFNPKTLATNLGITLPKMSDKNAFTKLNAKMDIAASINKATLSNIKLTLDDTHLKGKANIPFSSKIDVNLNIDNINLDRYLPTPSIKPDKEAKKTNIKQKNTIEPALIPIALLTKIDIDTEFKLNKVQIKKTHWTNLHIVAKANKGRVNIKPLNLQGYGASIKSSLQLHAKNKNVSLTAALNIKKLKSGELLKDFMDVKNLQGRLSLNANITSQGVKLSQIKKNLNGKTNFKLQDGIIKGFDLEYEINKLDAKIKRKKEPKKPSPLQTKFTNLTASAKIKSGIIYNKDLRAATPFTRIIGNGKVDLVKEKLAYVVTVKLTNSSKLENKTPFEKLNSVPLDVHIKGAFDKPRIEPDYNKALKKLVKRSLGKQEMKLKKSLKKEQDKLKEKLGNDLKKLFKF